MAKEFGLHHKGVSVAKLKAACKCAAREQRTQQTLTAWITRNACVAQSAASSSDSIPEDNVGAAVLREVQEHQQPNTLTALMAENACVVESVAQPPDSIPELAPDLRQALPAARKRVVAYPSWLRSKGRFAQRALQRATLKVKANGFCGAPALCVH